MSVQDDKGIDAGRSSDAAPFHVEDLLGYMRGAWLFERKVFDGLRGDEATCTGRSVFTPHRHNGVEALNYAEQGELNLGDLTITTEREYIYAFPAPSQAEVRFTDGRFFHLLDLTKGMVRVEHVCGEDTYQGLFRILSEKAWLSVWRVTGPRKSQVITTHYLRDLPH